MSGTFGAFLVPSDVKSIFVNEAVFLLDADIEHAYYHTVRHAAPGTARATLHSWVSAARRHDSAEEGAAWQRSGLLLGTQQRRGLLSTAKPAHTPPSSTPSSLTRSR